MNTALFVGAAGVAAALAVYGQPVTAGPPPPVPAVLRNYQPVTAERLKNPEDGNWLMIRRTYDGWGYSPLTQITPDNAARLKPLWIFSTGEPKVHEAAPIVNNGVMFISTPNNQVIAIDAKSGNLLWRYRRIRPEGASVPHDTSRGVALYGDKVLYAAGEAVLVALDAKTGKEVWTTKVADNTAGYYISLAPLVAGGKVMVGASGGEFGIRGFVAAFDLDTGKELWRTYTIPAPGDPGSETWPKGDEWKNGGGSVWVTGNYDPQTNLAFWGVGNGGPWMGDRRPGDNLYVSSTIALDVATGAIKGHFQYHPNDSWDWDEVSPPVLVDFQRGGRTIKGLIDVARDGYLWFLDRSNVEKGGKIKFIEGKPYVKQNVFTRLDPETGRPEVDPAHKPGTGKRAEYCPSLHGGKNWPPISFSPKTRMIYIPANENLCAASLGADTVEYTPGRGYTGTATTNPSFFVQPGADHIGEVQAWNVDTGQRVWTHSYAKSPNWGAMLATAGGVVFSGGTSDRKFHAFDAATGKLLWEFPTNSGILAPPSSFIVDGKQYVAVLTGWGGDSRGMQANLNRVFPGEYPEVPEGGALWVFALE
ncbi:MAG: PQQ-dependent dehydrogenase, methanol/ethanol family [Bryobacterales bacterium]|nr:PQQ-dependent dehydrogenase, methanol/ethanol family [Bryobacterales bacterium]MBV9400722.1 PQQ-dependent dehydrogenase, methanol/ethanol family [Bryobacterales bacterium]